MIDRKLVLKKGERVAQISALTIGLLGLIKLFIAFVSNSVALFADAAHSLIDIFACIAVYIGLWFARRDPTEKFPYGYYKVETFAALIVSIIILVVGVEILRESILKFLTPSEINSPLIVLLIAFISAVISYFLSEYKVRTGKAINSQALISEGKHSRIDIYSATIVFIGVSFSYFGLFWVEALAGIVIGGLIIWLGVNLGKDATLVLMDAALKSDYINKIRQIAESVQGVYKVSNIKMRRSGPFVFGEIQIYVTEELNVEKAHRISEEVEFKIKEAVKEIDSLIIHVEPIKKESFTVAIPVDENKGLESRLCAHFGRAPLFFIVKVDKKKIREWSIRENPGIKLEKKRGISAAKFLVEKKVDVVLANELGEGPFHLLKDNFVDIYKFSNITEVSEVLNALLDGALQKMEAPKGALE
jgi:cation diffusion facilitator family transporter